MARGGPNKDGDVIALPRQTREAMSNATGSLLERSEQGQKVTYAVIIIVVPGPDDIVISGVLATAIGKRLTAAGFEVVSDGIRLIIKKGGKEVTDDAAEAARKIIIEERATCAPKVWTKAPSEYINETRHAFEKSGGVREQFWKNEFAQNRNGYSPQNQTLIKQGKAPFGTDGKSMVLHHKTPIEYGGTNDFGNLQPMRYTDHSLTPNFGPLHTPPFPE